MDRFTIYRGTNKTIEIAFNDDAGPVVLTGGTVTLEVARDLETPTANLLLNKTMTVLTGANTHVGSYNFVPADLTNIGAGVYEAQGRAVISGSTYVTDVFEFEVKSNVKA